MSKYRTPATCALAVLLLLAVIVLTTPNGGTRARWSAAEQAEVPALTMGVIGFDVAGAGSSATLTNTSGFGVRYRPAQVSLLDAGAAVTPPAGLRFAYRSGAACSDAKASAQWTAAAPGGSTPVVVPGSTWAPLERDRPAGMCLTVSTDGVTEDALRRLAGRPLQVVTQVEASSLDGGTWSATRSWTAPFTVDLPPVTAPSAPVPADAAQCRADNSTAVLRWAWSDRPGGPAVTEWQVLARPMGSTGTPIRVKTVPDGAARTAQLGAADLLRVPDLRSSEDYEVLVRAVFAAGGTTHADSAYAWRIKTPGNSGNIICEGLPS
ncbi:hypothetical protein GMA12_12430 [Kocuria sediminis]|uniref:Fibronectin type-III domain-containing protein n=1 Tax=Kocuria sediminis TaxID=1038857 RepID=A0A6N8GSW9_9MICC|nr:hypothetical protein [Kocuria sediminis]MUN63934.1 hypothetical protein [Kocuria sediminis]